MNESKRHISLAAIDPYVQSNIVSPKEKINSSRNLVEWGDGNRYPDYLLDLVNNVATLRSIVLGNVDFIAGDDISIEALNESLVDGVMNTKGDTIRQQVKDLAKDYEVYGGFALQVIRNYNGEVAEVYYIDMRYLRMNKECNVFYYSEHWADGGRKNVVVYPAFMPNLNWASLSEEERNRHASSILFVKNVHSQVYPAPMYAASILACETERAINEYHFNEIANGFAPQVIINFNNGDPGDKMKEEIENDVEEKFCGTNGRTFILSFNKDKGSATTFETLKVEDFGQKYQALAERSRQEIFCSFRAIPLLFGLTAGTSTGFSTDEFEQSFKLYNRTQIRPVQRMISEAYERIYGRTGVLTIKPFSLDNDNETSVN